MKMLLAALLSFSATAQAFVWDESVNGDLSGNNTAPTFIPFDPGVNTVKGIMGGDPGEGIPLDRDIFTITLASNQTLTSINVITFEPGGASFYAISSGTTISLTNGSAHLSNILIKQTGEILPTLASGAYNGGTGLSNPVGPGGTYTVWFQEVSSVITYEMAYTVAIVPEPSTVALAGIAGFILLWVCKGKLLQRFRAAAPHITGE